MSFFQQLFQTLPPITPKLISPDNQIYLNYTWDSDTRLIIFDLPDMKAGTWNLILSNLTEELSSENEKERENDKLFLIVTTHQRKKESPPIKLKGDF